FSLHVFCALAAQYAAECAFAYCMADALAGAGNNFDQLAQIGINDAVIALLFQQVLCQCDLSHVQIPGYSAYRGLLTISERLDDSEDCDRMCFQACCRLSRSSGVKRCQFSNTRARRDEISGFRASRARTCSAQKAWPSRVCTLRRLLMQNWKISE